MRRVTVRVSEDTDWHFRAEGADGRMVFEVEYSQGETTAAPATQTADAPQPAPANPYPLSALLGDVETGNKLDRVLKAFGRNMPVGPAMTRVLEIGGFIGEMTKRLHRITEGERPEPVYMVDPFIAARQDEFTPYCQPENMADLKKMLSGNVKHISPRILDGTHEAACDSMAPMNVDLLCVSAGLSTDDLVELLSIWLQHLSANGVILARGSAEAIENLDLLPLDFTALDEGWFMATKKEATS